MTTIILNRNKGEFGFEIKDELNHVVQTDSSAGSGGTDAGFRPMQLLLAALGSCSAIDIISILKKQRQQIERFEIVVQGEREPAVTPSLWKNISITFLISGEVDAGKATRAADLSVKKYCSVAETLRRAGAKIQWKTEILNTDDRHNTPA